MSPQPTHLLFADLECTGEDPRTDAILEVGVILVRAEPDLPEVDRGSMVIRPAGASLEHDRLWARMPEVVRRMHADNGLWNEATVGDRAWPLMQADAALARFVAERVEGPVPLAGSGVAHFDHPFIKEQLPNLRARLTYWPVDFGSVRRALQLAGRDDLIDLDTDVRAKPHRALGDVELHLTEARRYLAAFGTLPPVPA